MDENEFIYLFNLFNLSTQTYVSHVRD